MKTTRAILIVTFAAAGVCFGQAGQQQQAAEAGAEQGKPAVDQLSTVETVAIQSLLSQYQALQSEFNAASTEIVKAHPGYHLDLTPPSGVKLVKDGPAPEKAAAPGKAPAAPATVAPKK